MDISVDARSNANDTMLYETIVQEASMRYNRVYNLAIIDLARGQISWRCVHWFFCIVEAKSRWLKHTKNERSKSFYVQV